MSLGSLENFVRLARYRSAHDESTLPQGDRLVQCQLCYCDRQKQGGVTRHRLINTLAGVVHAVGGDYHHQVCRECR